MRVTRGKASRAVVACALLMGVAAGWPAAAEEPPARAPYPRDWETNPYRNFGPRQVILPGRVLLWDEAEAGTLAAVLSADLRRLSVELFEKQGWRVPFAEGDPLRVYVARKETSGVRRLAVHGLQEGRLQGPAIQIDGFGLSDGEIAREVARLFAYATLAAYDVPDTSFFTQAAAGYLANLPESENEREAALAAAAAPELDLNRAPLSVGRLFVEELSRSAGGPSGLRAAFERARDTGEAILPLAERLAAETSGERADSIGLRFAARLYTNLETEPAPSRIGLEDLLAGAFDTAVAGSLALRHRTFLAAEGAAALRVAWPADGGLAAAVVRYRDAQLPPDVVLLEPGKTQTIPFAGVSRVDWVVEGGTARVPSAPAFFERVAEFPFVGLSASTDAAGEGAKLLWTTASHEQLAGWVVFREQLLPDGRIARTGPQIMPTSSQGDESLRYAYVDSSVAPGAWYRYTVWAVTEDGLLARAFSATLKAAD
jgi:hypothetical protein